jgi:hypothetical protein
MTLFAIIAIAWFCVALLTVRALDRVSERNRPTPTPRHEMSEQANQEEQHDRTEA